MMMTIELIYTDDATGDQVSEGHLIESPTYGEPMLMIGDRPVIDMQQVEPAPHSLARWTAKAQGCSGVEVRIWEMTHA